MAICGSAGRGGMLRSAAGSRGRGGIRRLAGRGFLATLTLRYSVFSDCFSATWTAPPPITAHPAAQAESFAMAVLIDITDSLLVLVARDRNRTTRTPTYIPQQSQNAVNATILLTGIALVKRDKLG